MLKRLFLTRNVAWWDRILRILPAVLAVWGYLPGLHNRAARNRVRRRRSNTIGDQYDRHLLDLWAAWTFNLSAQVVSRERSATRRCRWRDKLVG